MTVLNRPLADITSEAIHVLAREIGAADTMRFLSQFSTGAGDYTQERSALFGGITLDAMLAEIKQGADDGHQTGKRD
jgi:hypothetical protein